MKCVMFRKMSFDLLLHAFFLPSQGTIQAINMGYLRQF